MSRMGIMKYTAMAALICHDYLLVFGQEGGLNRDYYFDAISTTFQDAQKYIPQEPGDES